MVGLERLIDIKKKYWVAIILALICVTTFANGLHNAFLMDDHSVIFEDQRIYNLSNILHYLIIGSPDPFLNSGEHFYYRPLCHIIPMIYFHLFGDNPFGYHFANLILFWLSSFMIFEVCLSLGATSAVALITAVFYAIHPINGITVNYITVAYLILQLILMMGCVRIFIAYQKSQRSKPWLFVSGIFCLLLALLCHESAIVMPFYIFLISLILLKRHFFQAISDSAAYAVACLGYLLFRSQVVSLKTVIVDKIPTLQTDFFSFWATFSKTVYWYLVKLITLDGIVLIWNTPILKHGIWIWIIGSGVFVGMIILLTRKWGRDLRTLSLWWFVVGFLPAILGSMVHAYLGLIIEPHWFLFSSVGFFLLLSLFIVEIDKQFGSRIFWIVLIMLGITYTIVSWRYNRLWSDEKRYLHYSLQEAENPIFYGLLGGLYQKNGNVELAKKYLNAELSKGLDDYRVISNLGLIEINRKNYDLGRKYLLYALSLNPASGPLWNNLGMYYRTIGELKLAINAYETALSLDPYWPQTRFNLLDCYLEGKRYPEAMRLLREYQKIRPKDHSRDYQLALISLEVKDKQTIVALSEEFLKVKHDKQGLIDWGGLYASHGYDFIALKFYDQALRLDPKFSEVYLEVGKVLGNREDYFAAIDWWSKGKNLNPEDKRFDVLISEAQRLISLKPRR